MKTLNEAATELGKAVYESSSAAGAAGAPGAESAKPKKDDVIDAEFEVKDGN
jgi:hypothetical protein